MKLIYSTTQGDNLNIITCEYEFNFGGDIEVTFEEGLKKDSNYYLEDVFHNTFFKWYKLKKDEEIKYNNVANSWYIPWDHNLTKSDNIIIMLITMHEMGVI